MNYLKKNLKNILPAPISEFLMHINDLRRPKLSNYKNYIKYTDYKSGIEIGGPSKLFRSTLPIYQNVERVDGVNFSNSTVWEGNIKAGENYNYFSNRFGTQFISDGTDLSHIADNKYDFLLSSNCLEHIANPLKALLEWKRVLSNGSALILVLPNQKNNFDHKRPVTTFQQLIKKLKNNTLENDLSSLDEILELHDLSKDPQAGNFDNFKKRSLDNFNNRTLHHHVFDLKLMQEMFDFLEMNVILKNDTNKDFIILATK